MAVQVQFLLAPPRVEGHSPETAQGLVQPPVVNKRLRGMAMSQEDDNSNPAPDLWKILGHALGSSLVSKTGWMRSSILRCPANTCPIRVHMVGGAHHENQSSRAEASEGIEEKRDVF